MRMTVKYLHRRGGKLRYRRRIPERLQEYFDGRTEFVEALDIPAGQELKAIPKINRINKRVSQMMMQAEKTALGLADPHVMAIANEQWALERKYIGYDRSGIQCDEDEHESDYDLWLSDVIWQAQKRLGPLADVELSDLSADDRMKIETVRRGRRVETPLTLQRVVEAYTEHRRGGDLGGGQKDALGRLDRWLQRSRVCARYNAEGHIQLDDLSRADAAKFVTSQHTDEGNSAGTIKRTLTALNAIWNFAIDHFEKEDLKNPWKGLKPPKASIKENPEHLRLPFAKQHVEAIQRGLRGNRLNPEMRLIIRMMMCTGARPLELGGLLADEVFQDGNGVWIQIQRNSIREIKNSKTRRRVPIVDQSLAADVWELAQKRKGGPLFQKGFHNTDNLSQRVTRFLREKCGIPKSTRLVPYSFRHTVTEALRVSEAPMDVTKAIVGHSDGSITENYGAGSVSLERMREALTAAMEKLGEVDLYHYKAEELMQ